MSDLSYYFTLESTSENCPKELQKAIQHLARQHLATCKGTKPEKIRLADFRIRTDIRIWMDQKYLTPSASPSRKKPKKAKRQKGKEK